jgi:amino acid transporter
MMKTLLLNKILTMKKLMYVLGVVLFGVVITAFTLSAASLKQSAAGPFEDVVGAIKQGDVSALSRYLDNTVEISMAGKSNSYSKAQAEIILKDFFARNQVKTFELIHQVESNGGSRVGIANVGTSGGTFRTSFFLQKKGGSMVLNELRFESK